ncbi:hypothetical protein FGRMN_2300 [Fusarium graminum]|nr:hypothetical protein FGRMN_2300 [Fusarium graminum]
MSAYGYALLDPATPSQSKGPGPEELTSAVPPLVHLIIAKGHKPESAFGDTLLAKVRQPESRHAHAQRQALRYGNRSAGNLHSAFDLNVNKIIQKNPPCSPRVEEQDETWNSSLTKTSIWAACYFSFERLGRTKRISDSQLEDTILVRNVRAAGMADKNMIQATKRLALVTKFGFEVPSEVLNKHVPEGYTSASELESDNLSGHRLFDLAKFDILADVAGSMLFSNLNYLSITCWLMITFMKLGERLKEARNLVYLEAHENSGPWQREKRVTLTLLALRGENEECLKIVAYTLNQGRSRFIDFIYWKNLETEL